LSVYPDHCTLIQGTSATHRRTSVIDCGTASGIRAGVIPSSIDRMDDVLEYHVSCGFGTSKHDSAVFSRYVFLYLDSLEVTHSGFRSLSKGPTRETTPGYDPTRFSRYH